MMMIWSQIGHCWPFNEVKNQMKIQSQIVGSLKAAWILFFIGSCSFRSKLLFRWNRPKLLESCIIFFDPNRFKWPKLKRFSIASKWFTSTIRLKNLVDTSMKTKRFVIFSRKRFSFPRISIWATHVPYEKRYGELYYLSA